MKSLSANRRDKNLQRPNPLNLRDYKWGAFNMSSCNEDFFYEDFNKQTGYIKGPDYQRRYQITNKYFSKLK